jgi:hypothetical protein
MPIRQQLFFLAVAAVFLLIVLELVRRRRLRVEYAWLWIGSGIALITVILRYELLIWLTELAGAVIPTSTVFFLATLFLALLGLHYSVRLTALTREVKELAQELALLRAHVDEQPRGQAPD